MWKRRVPFLFPFLTAPLFEDTRTPIQVNTEPLTREIVKDTSFGLAGTRLFKRTRDKIASRRAFMPNLPTQETHEKALRSKA